MRIVRSCFRRRLTTNSAFIFIVFGRLAYHFSLHSITSSGFLPQPAGKTAIVSGLNYITRIFALLGEILVRIRVDKRSPPQGPFLTARLDEVRNLHTRILSALAHVPPSLRLKPVTVETGAVASLRHQLGMPSQQQGTHPPPIAMATG